jgi:hypothetical protein
MPGDRVDGFNFVIESTTRVFTYRLVDKVVVLVSEGDKHDSKYSTSKHSFVAVLKGAGGLQFTVSIYASHAYYEQFEDNRAVYASIIGASISVGMSVLFLPYDFFLSRTARENAVVLETKRAFVRYIRSVC